MNFLEAEAKKTELKTKMLELWAWTNSGRPIYAVEFSEKMAEFKLAFETYYLILEDQIGQMLATVSFDSAEFQTVLKRELGEILTLLDGMMPTDGGRIQ